MNKWFLRLNVLFVTCLIVSNIIAVKVVSVFGLILPAAIIIFPISYIIGDVLTEVYGYKKAKETIYLGFAANIVAVIFIYLGLLLPPFEFWNGQEAYVLILGYTPRILFASFLAYLIGELSNAFAMSKIKILTNNKYLWLRAISSTIIGQGLDSVIFISISFWGTLPNEVILSMVFTQWGIKILYEVLVLPITYFVISYIKSR